LAREAFGRAVFTTPKTKPNGIGALPTLEKG
jgi:hypothetical protein